MIVYGALLPHPPLLVPEVGGGRVEQVRVTRRGVRQLCQNLALSQPECLVLITPHGAASTEAVTSLVATAVSGSLARFGAPQVTLSVDIDHELAEVVGGAAARVGMPLLELAGSRSGLAVELDHGLLVPLYYLREAGVEVPVVILNPCGHDARSHHALGCELRQALAAIPRRVAVVASGDLSHRLLETGPYGFDEMGPVFDRLVVQALEGHPDPETLLALPPDMVKRAGVCGYKPLALLLGCLSGARGQVFSYEGPLGVGYASVGLQPDPALEPALLGLAKAAVEAHVLGKPLPQWPRPLPASLARRAAVFVTLRKGRALRGCIGTLKPVRPHLADELSAAAVGACSRDPRFGPVRHTELAELSYSVYVLGELERIEGEHQLDPQRYGLVVRSGSRSGCLLPGIEQVTTISRQLELARQKAEIGPDEIVSLERFEVERYPFEDC